ncbi:hypothetical protein D3C75_1254400 [compost metagenome]
MVFIWNDLGDNRLTLLGSGMLLGAAVRASYRGDYWDAVGCVAIGALCGAIAWYELGQGRTVAR